MLLSRLDKMRGKRLSSNFFLTHLYNDTQVNLTLELFLRMLIAAFPGRIRAVMTYGSLVFEDLAPGYGDLDFLAVFD